MIDDDTDITLFIFK